MDTPTTATAATATKVRKANRSDVHRRTGISLSGVSRILSGKRTPSAHNLKLVALALGVSMDELHACLTAAQKRKSRTNYKRRTVAA